MGLPEAKVVAVPWLYDGVPDRPEWLRRRALKPRRFGRLMVRLAAEDGAARRAKVARYLRRSQMRSRARRRAYWILTEPVVTFSLGLAGGPLIALELDRLSSPAKDGSWPLLVLGVALVAFGAWLSRTKAIVDDRRREAWDTDDLDRRFRLVEERIGEVGNELGDQLHDLTHNVEILGRWLQPER